jgi:hypothetical protein
MYNRRKHEEKKMSGSLGIDRLSLGEARLFDKNISQILHDWFGGIPVHTWGYGGSMGRYLKTYKKSLFGLTELVPPDSIGDVDIVVCFPSEDLKKKALKNLGERVGYQKNGKPRRRFEWVTYNKNKQSEFATAQVDLFVTTPRAFGATELFYLAPKSLQEGLRAIARFRGLKFSPTGIWRADANQIENKPLKTEYIADVFDLLGVEDISCSMMSKYASYTIR